ncbi:hypothetical protein AB0L44_37560 [Nonomuraea wenchangensis]|uniref:hypothetical protein n=1 Tax=Nonomuraea wenchangensis TaxID=568860 RepID=UPI003432C651
MPPGGIALAYAKNQRPLLLMLLFAVVVQAVALEWMLAASDSSSGLRAIVMMADVYQLLFVLALGAASATRPHVVTAEELRIRYGAYFDVRVPRELIASVKISRNYNARGVIAVTDGHLTVGVDAQTNLIVNLTAPITVTRPLGRRERITTIRFYADDPGSALRSLTGRLKRVSCRRRRAPHELTCSSGRECRPATRRISSSGYGVFLLALCSSW